MQHMTDNNLVAEEQYASPGKKCIDHVINRKLFFDLVQYLKKGAQIYVEGQLTTRKWKDEQSGQDKYSTEVVLQGYNSTLTMLGGGNTGGGIQNDTTQQNNIEDSSQVSNDMDDEIPF